MFGRRVHSWAVPEMPFVPKPPAVHSGGPEASQHEVDPRSLSTCFFLYLTSNVHGFFCNMILSSNSNGQQRRLIGTCLIWGDGS